MRPYLERSSLPSHFTFRGRSLPYNRVAYNVLGERAVEVPIAFDFLARQNPAGKICEIGNVLSNYEGAAENRERAVRRRVIDMYEKAPGVENIDMMELPPGGKFDAVVCVSTVEHVGQNWLEAHADRDREAPLKAIAKIYDLLEVGGRALVTMPFGKLLDGWWYIQFSGEYLDLLATKYGIPEGAMTKGFLKRAAMEATLDNPRQLWVEAEENELGGVEYNSPLPYGNAVAVLELHKQPAPFAFNPDAPPTPLRYHEPIIIGSVFGLEFFHHVRPNAAGEFLSEARGPIFSFAIDRPQPATYELLFSVEVDAPCGLLLECAASYGAEDPRAGSGYTFQSPVAGTSEKKLRLEILPGTEKCVVRFRNVAGSKVKAYVRNFELRRARPNGH